ncbi:MAG TPA: hypothetical protein VI874_02420, partial [Candidatus Norongarragalinales archaeon]|nr:hypothetical protein [Candidatus Norongarragalinales archaeon]
SRKTAFCLFSSLCAVSMVYVLSKSVFPATPVFMVPVLVAVYLSLYAFLAIKWGAVEEDDLSLLNAVTNKTKRWFA